MPSDIINKASNYWSVNDFAIEGTYSTPDDVEYRLKHIIDYTSAELAILLIRIGNRLFKSSTIISGFNHLAIEEKILEIDFGQPSRPWRHRSSSGSFDVIVQDYLGLAFLGELLPSEIFVQQYTQKPEDFGFTRGPEVSLLLVEAKYPIDNRDLTELYFTSNFLAPIVLHLKELDRLKQKRAIERQLKENPVIDRSKPMNRIGGPMKRAAEALLSSVVEITRSDGGHVLLDHRKKIMQAAIQGCRMLDMGNLNKRNHLVCNAIRNNKHFVINDPVAFNRKRPELLMPECCFGREVAVIVIPITQFRLDGGSLMGIGAILVHRSLKRGLPYSDIDVSNIADVINRFALWRSRILAAVSDDQYRHISHNSNDPDFKNKLLSLSSIENNTSVPAEAALAKEELQNSCQRILECTVSDRVSLWFIKNDGHSLTRFTMFPADYSLQLVNYKSVSESRSATVSSAITGEVVRVPEDMPLRKDQIKRGIRSQICIPILSSGRLIAVMSLVSLYDRGYSDHQFRARAMAEQLGLLLAVYRRATDRDVFEINSRTLVYTHEIKKLCVRLTSLVTNSNMEESQKCIVLDTVKQLDERLLGQISENRSYTQPTEVVSVIESTNSDYLLDTTDLLLEIDVGEENSAVLTPECADALSIAYRQVLENGLSHASYHNKIIVHFDKIAYGGQSYCKLTISSPCGYISRRDQSMLYRVPIRKSGKLISLGCYIAGEVMRMIGGNTYLEGVVDGTRLYTSIQVPIIYWKKS